jgi:peptide/nickel transport system permease protein
MSTATTPARITRSLRRARIDVGGTAISSAAILLVLAVVFAKWLAPFDPTRIVGYARLAPGSKYWFGTDHLGRDVLSRTLYGGQETLVMACASTLFAAAIGVPLGIMAGYLGKWRATVIMRGMDILLAFPGLLLALIIVTIGGAGTGTTTIAVGISFVPIFAVVIFGTTQRVRAEEYIAAAQVVGCGSLRIMTRHVLPIVMIEVVVLVSSTIGWATLLGAALNFLGFGVSPPTAEWGADLGAGSHYLSQAWWISAAPGFAITLTIFLANFLGDYFAKRLDAQPATVILIPSSSQSTN